MNGLPAKSQRIYPRDWTDSVVYDGFHGLDRTGWAWQWLKRNREFSSHLQECSFLVDKPVMLKPRIVRSRCNQKLMPWRLMFCRPEDRRRYLVSAEQSLRFGRTCITYVDKGRSRFIRHFQILCLSYTSYHARQLPTFSAERPISSSSNINYRRYPSRGTCPFEIYHFRYEAPERTGACLKKISCILSHREISKCSVSRRTTRTSLENDAPGLGRAAGGCIPPRNRRSALWSPNCCRRLVCGFSEDPGPASPAWCRQAGPWRISRHPAGRERAVRQEVSQSRARVGKQLCDRFVRSRERLLTGLSWRNTMTAYNRKTGKHTRSNLYQDITDKIIAQLEQGTFPWVQPWGSPSASASLGLPQNAATERNYSGINVLILWGAVFEAGYSSQSWLTFRQALKLGGTVRKGERGVTVVYASRFIPGEGKKKGQFAPDTSKDPRAIPFLKRFTVFNLDQCDGLPEQVTAQSVPPDTSLIEPKAEELIRASGIDFRIGGRRAFYSPADDYVRVPPPQAYFEPINWHRTALHECSHATGHETRLNRDQSGSFGSKKYAFEELVAEMSAAFLCASLGIVPTVRHADYLASWLQVLREDNRAIVRAASQASKSADYLLACINPATEAGSKEAVSCA